jgi:hypothetical protein
MDWDTEPDDSNHRRLGPISTHEVILDSEPYEISIEGLTPAANQALNEVLKPRRLRPNVVKKAGLVATIRCSCGWGMEVSQPGNSVEGAEEKAKDSWRDHLAEVTPPLLGEEFYAATWQVLLDAEQKARIPNMDWYKGAIRSSAQWRRDFPKWKCEHEHLSEGEAIACAVEALKNNRWHLE